MNYHMSKQVILTALFSLLFLSFSTYASELFSIKSDLQPQSIVLDATIEAIDQSTLSAQTSGRVTKINFDTNNYVTKGSILLEMTSTEQGAKLAVAEAEILRATALHNESVLSLQRYKKLFLQGAISKGKLDQAEANEKTSKQLVRSAKASLKDAQESLSYTVIKAPYSGVVTNRFISVGETITPGAPLFSGMSLNKLRAVTEIPQRYLQTLKKDPEFTITLPNGELLHSKKVTLFNYADQQSHAFKVRIDLPTTDQLILPGMWVKAEFVSGFSHVINIPQSAIITNNELNAVYRDVNGKPVLTQIRLGKKIKNSVAVLAGLQEGDVIHKDAYQTLQVLESK